MEQPIDEIVYQLWLTGEKTKFVKQAVEEEIRIVCSAIRRGRAKIRRERRGRPAVGCEGLDDQWRRSTFKFWEVRYKTLADVDGGYALVWYRAEGQEITVVSSQTIWTWDLDLSN